MQNLIFRAAVAAALIFAMVAVAQDKPSVDVAVFNDDGDLIVPDNINEWIFLGSSLGMGYSQVNFNPDSPGMFQIVRMEPTAYRTFKETGELVDGTMITLPKECVECHKRDGAYDGVFVQFYPPIHDYLPEKVQEDLAARARTGGH